jgi:hypothetical protein
MFYKNVTQVEVSYIPHVTIPTNYGIKQINPIFTLNLQWILTFEPLLFFVIDWNPA